MKPTLVVLAAGMGSRYGSLKQLDKLGPNDETIIDYSVFDAIRAGFGRVIFIIRKEFATEFANAIGDRYAKQITIEYAFQELDKLPDGFSLPPGRQKPWGTGHALLMCKDMIREPFAVINGDDFYGKKSFELLAQGLNELQNTNDCMMCGFMLENTLSEFGSVSRGLCSISENGKLESIVEHLCIEKQGSEIISTISPEKQINLSGQELVSLNMWGFSANIFDIADKLFKQFLDESGAKPKSEFFIPSIVDFIIKQNQASVDVKISPDSWFGVTYQEDKKLVREKINKLIKAGTYPQKLF